MESGRPELSKIFSWVRTVQLDQSEYVPGREPLREKCLNMESFLVGIQKNTDHKKLRIWTLFTQ